MLGDNPIPLTKKDEKIVDDCQTSTELLSLEKYVDGYSNKLQGRQRMCYTTLPVVRNMRRYQIV